MPYAEFKKNYAAITKDTGKLFLFAGDQKIEHMNSVDPKVLFDLASQTECGAFATHLGLIQQYGTDYPNVNYIAKLNGKTNLVPREQQDPFSKQLWSIDDVLLLKQETGINLCGVGYTIYLGSAHEALMLHEAAQIVQEAHHHGFVAILWIYVRGKAVTAECSPHLIAGAAGVGATLGADFVKVKTPQSTEKESSAQALQQAVSSAGKTKVICAGGPVQQPTDFIRELHEQLTIGGTAGAAVGRNIYQHAPEKATKIAKATAGLIYKNYSLEQALTAIE